MEKTFSLIEGSFKVNESKELLRQMYADKINFHHQKQLSQWETQGQADPKTTQRVSLLKSNLNDLLVYLSQMEHDNQELEISAQINIKPKNVN